MTPEMSRDEVQKSDEKNRSEKFLPVDVASYVSAGKDGKPSDRFAGIWVESNHPWLAPSPRVFCRHGQNSSCDGRDSGGESRRCSR